MNSTPRPELEAFVRDAYGDAALEPMPGDASDRRFWRMRLPDGSTRVVMDYGAPFQDDPDDVVLGTILRSAGLPVASTERIEPEVGCLVQQDLGDVTLEREVQRRRECGEPIAPLYEQAVEICARFSSHGTVALRASDRARSPALDINRFRFELDYFVEHFLEGLTGFQPGDALRREMRDLGDRAASTTRRPVLCHRDFHSRNILVLPGGDLALVDIQDARRGPDTYDLVSLLCDAYLDLDDDLVEGSIERFRIRACPDDDAKSFRDRYDLISLQRMVKALGTFGFQASRRGRRGYLEGVPRTVRRILALRERVPGYPELYAALSRPLPTAT